MLWSGISGVRKCRGCSAADNCRCLVDQRVILEGLDHEQGKVHAAGDIAFEDGVANVPTPDGQALTLAFFQVAPAHDGPPRVAGKDPPACFDLIVKVRKAGEPSEPA